MSGTHPFTISGSDDTSIYFTIKTLGDHTKNLYKNLKVGMKIHVSKPFGHMTFQTKKDKHIWIAGGIGVTPFISYLRSQNTLDKPAHLYYAVRNFEDAVHVDVLTHYQKQHPHFSFDIMDSQTKGRLTLDMLALDDDTSVSMCGPKPMIDVFVKGIRKENKRIEIHYEAFSFTGNLVKDVFRIGLNYAKQLVKKFNT
jgi:predicted ferric reductase